MSKVVTVTLRGIHVHSAGEGDAEWRLRIIARPTAGGIGVLDKEWRADGVSNGDFFPLGTLPPPQARDWQAALVLADGEQIEVRSWGFEEDDPGFPLFDEHDDLPDVLPTVVLVDPNPPGALVTTIEPVMFSARLAEHFHYTLEMGFNVVRVP